jgi:hypothetical protein
VKNAELCLLHWRKKERRIRTRALRDGGSDGGSSSSSASKFI